MGRQTRNITPSPASLTPFSGPLRAPPLFPSKNWMPRFVQEASLLVIAVFTSLWTLTKQDKFWGWGAERWPPKERALSGEVKGGCLGAVGVCGGE